MDIQIKLDNGKYEYLFEGNGYQCVFRHGELWRDLTGDGFTLSMAQHVETLEARNAELLEAVKKAHEILLHEMDNGRTPSMLQGVGLGYFEDVIAGIEK